MIDTDKMRAALAATPLCQGDWTKKEGNSPTMLCAISAMVSFAGVQPDLIKAMADRLGGDEWFRTFASPVLLAEYNLPIHVAAQIPHIFDTQENEWRGVAEVLDLCERHNMDELLHTEALAEDRHRFPLAPQYEYLTVKSDDLVTVEFEDGTSIDFHGNVTADVDGSVTVTQDFSYPISYPIIEYGAPVLPKPIESKYLGWLSMPTPGKNVAAWYVSPTLT